MLPTYTRLLLVVLFASGSLFAEAQSARLKRAQRMMADLDYTEAISQFTQILETSDDPYAKISLAEAYRKTNDAANSEYWYGQVVRLPESQPIHKLFYGQALQQNGKCDQAREWYALFIQEQPDDLRGQYLARACDYEDELRTKNAKVYEVQHLDFNSSLDDFGAALYEGGVIFASDRSNGVAVKRDHAWTGNPFLELYYVKSDRTDEDDPLTTVYGQPEKFSNKFNSKYHDAAVSFTDDGNQLFFTRNNFNEGKTGKSDDGFVKLKIFYAERGSKKEDWGKLQSLPFNSDEYSVAHPALSPSGARLYFASDMPGGFGGMDIYYSEKDNGRWGPPINLGPVVNTEGHEAFPFADPTGKIYFASDGQIGLGGFDLYYTIEKGPGDFSQPENMGAPVNSNSDDFAVMVGADGEFGYFSSNRTGGAGRDDVYSFTHSGVPVEVLVINSETRLPIEGATVFNACNSATTITDVNGMSFIDMEEEQECELTASASDFEDASKMATTVSFDKTKLIVTIALKPVDSYTIEGFVFDESTGEPLAGSDVTLTSDCSEEETTITTDESGRYSFDLTKTCCFTVRATLPTYLAGKKSDICATDTAQTTEFVANLFLQPTVYAGVNDRPNIDADGPNSDARIYRDPNTNLYMDSTTGQPADGEINGRTYRDGVLENAGDSFEPGYSPTSDGTAIAYLLHIYYDFDRATIRKEAREDLDRLYTMMTENPEIQIEIGSHTDARGPDDYNLRLSQRRAEAVVRYMMQRGVDRTRIVPKGYGETVPVNNCADNVPCSEREHQFNRRTEFKVLGCKDCDENGKISNPRDEVQVNRCKNCPF